MWDANLHTNCIVLKFQVATPLAITMASKFFTVLRTLVMRALYVQFHVSVMCAGILSQSEEVTKFECQ